MNGDLKLMNNNVSIYSDTYNNIYRGFGYLEDLHDGIADIPEDLIEEVDFAYKSAKGNWIDRDIPDFYEIVAATGSWIEERCLDEARINYALEEIVSDDEIEDILAEYYDFASYNGYLNFYEDIIKTVLDLYGYTYIDDYEEIVVNEAQQNIFDLIYLGAERSMVCLR